MTPKFLSTVKTKVLPVVEMIALVATLIAFTMKYMVINGGDELLMISLSLLAGVYFYGEFLPLESAEKKDGDQPKGFLDLFVNIICVKMSGIACSVVIVGALFRLLHLHGAGEMLFIGLPILGLTIVVLGIAAVTKPDGSKFFPILYRSVPVCLFGLYFFTTTPA